MTDFYHNPLAGAHNVTKARTDQGVDFFARVWSPIYPVGRCVISRVSTKSGWPGGGVVQYILLDGPRKGEEHYVAEWIKPKPWVKVGAVISPGKAIARFRFSLFTKGPWAWRGIETGFIRPGTNEPCSTDTSGAPTEGGIRYTRFLNSVGCDTQQHFGPGPDTCPCGVH